MGVTTVRKTRTNTAGREVFSGWVTPLGYTTPLWDLTRVVDQEQTYCRATGGPATGCTINGQGQAASIRTDGDFSRQRCRGL